MWERLFALVQKKDVQLGLTFLDGTTIRAHQKAAGASRRSGRAAVEDGSKPRCSSAIGRWSGAQPVSWGVCTRACMIADAAGRAIGFALAPGQAQELAHAVLLLGCLPDFIHLNRNYAERLCAELHKVPAASVAGMTTEDRFKEWRAVATRYEKSARSSAGVLCLAAACDWLRR